MVFDQRYYESVWGTVHRHDYCASWADRLIRRLDSGTRILDIGTGCGFLVKILRDRGVDAWGVDTSEYALANCCAPGFVLNASATDLPFSDEYFDLVFSNGLWEYLTEEEIRAGRNEIWRVGKAQEHQIDHDGCDFRDDFVTWKSLEWWNEQLSAPKVLVACPTHELKEYAHQQWIDAVRAIDYPNYEVFVVDNSPTPDCFNRWREIIPMQYLSHPGDQSQRQAASNEIIRQKFLAGNYKWWWSLEIDIIPDPSMLRLLIRQGKDADWTCHCYPGRGSGTDEQICSGIGNTLWSRKLMGDFSFAGTGDATGVDAAIWNWVRPQTGKYRTIELWSHLPVKHIGL